MKKILIGFDGVNSVVAKWLGFKNASFTGRDSVRGFAEVQNNHRLEPRFLVMGRLFTGFLLGHLTAKVNFHK